MTQFDNANVPFMQPVPQKDKTVGILNQLIVVCRTGAYGYKTAAKALNSDSSAKLLHELSAAREQYVGELVELVNRFGGEPAQSETPSAPAHRAWINLKSVLNAGDEAILAECLRGEEVALKVYFKAMYDNLPETVRDVLRTHLSGIRSAYQRVDSLASTLGNSAR